MPFQSKRQLQTCYGKRLTAESQGKKWTWDCDEWTRETKDPRCLPTLLNTPSKVPCRKRVNKTPSALYQGPRGGLFFYVGGVKVYVPKGGEIAAIERYGFPRPASSPKRKK